MLLFFDQNIFPSSSFQRSRFNPHISLNPNHITHSPISCSLSLFQREPHLERIYYAAPEQVYHTDQSCDHRSNLYSLGIYLHLFLTKEFPFAFHVESISDLSRAAQMVISSAPCIHPGICPPLKEIIATCLAKAPDQRYQSCHGLMRDLETCLERAITSPDLLRECFPLRQHDYSPVLRLGGEACFGRDTALAILDTAFRQAMESKRAHAFVLTGRPGSGLTTVLKRFGARLNQQGIIPVYDDRKPGLNTTCSRRLQRAQNMNLAISQLPPEQVDAFLLQFVTRCPEPAFLMSGDQLPVHALLREYRLDGQHAKPCPMPDPRVWPKERCAQIVAGCLAGATAETLSLVPLHDGFRMHTGEDPLPPYLPYLVQVYQGLTQGLRFFAVFSLSVTDQDEMQRAKQFAEALRALGLPTQLHYLTPLAPAHIRLWASEVFDRRLGKRALSRLARALTGLGAGNPRLAGELLQAWWKRGLLSFDYHATPPDWSVDPDLSLPASPTAPTDTDAFRPSHLGDVARALALPGLEIPCLRQVLLCAVILGPTFHLGELTRMACVDQGDYSGPAILPCVARLVQVHLMTASPAFAAHPASPETALEWISPGVWRAFDQAVLSGSERREAHRSLGNSLWKRLEEKNDAVNGDEISAAHHMNLSFSDMPRPAHSPPHSLLLPLAQLNSRAGTLPSLEPSRAIAFLQRGLHYLCAYCSEPWVLRTCRDLWLRTSCDLARQLVRRGDFAAAHVQYETILAHIDSAQPRYLELILPLMHLVMIGGRTRGSLGSLWRMVEQSPLVDLPRLDQLMGLSEEQGKGQLDAFCAELMCRCGSADPDEGNENNASAQTHTLSSFLLSLPPSSSPTHDLSLRAQYVLFSIARAGLHFLPSFALATSMARQMLAQGHCPASSLACLALGLTILHLLPYAPCLDAARHARAHARECFQVSICLLERYASQDVALQVKAYWHIGLMCLPCSNLRYALSLQEKARALAQEASLTEHLFWLHLDSAVLQFESGQPLSKVARFCANKPHGSNQPFEILVRKVAVYLPVLQFQGRTLSPLSLDTDECTETQLVQQAQSFTDAKRILALYRLAKMRIYVFFRQFNSSQRFVLRGPAREHATGMYFLLLRFYAALALLGATNEITVEACVLKDGEERCAELCKMVSDDCAYVPSLAQGELARVRGEPFDALKHYNRALDVASRQSITHICALCFEYLVNLHLQLGCETAARMAFHQALRLYHQWGATRKVRHCLEAYPPRMRAINAPSVVLNPVGPGSFPTGPSSRACTPQQASFSVCFETAASPSSSRETRPPLFVPFSLFDVIDALSRVQEIGPLLARVAELLLNQTGADRVCAVLGPHCAPDPASLGVHVTATPQSTTFLKPARKLGEMTAHLCASAAQHAYLQREVILWRQGSATTPQEAQQYLKQHCVQSLLCVPCTSSRWVLVLYLESLTSRNAFSQPSCAQFVHFLNAHMRCFLDNAAAYTELAEATEHVKKTALMSQTVLEHSAIGLAELDLSPVLRGESIDPAEMVRMLFPAGQKCNAFGRRLVSADMVELDESLQGQLEDIQRAMRERPKDYECVLDMAQHPTLASRSYSMRFVILPGAEATLSRVLLCFQDITERLKAREALEAFVKTRTQQVLRLEEERSHLVQLYALDRTRREEATANEQRQSGFLQTLCHEIRNPLQAALCSIESVKDQSARLFPPGSGSAPKFHRHIDDIDNVFAYVQNLLTDVLDYAKVVHHRAELHPVVFPLMQAVSESVRFTQSLALKNLPIPIEIETEGDLDQMVIKADRHRFMQVLLNLLTNAVKYSDQGTIRVHVSLQEALSEEPGGRVCISVTDQGQGMPESQVVHLFEPYPHQTSKEFRGTGLGLLISKHLVSMMGGSIRATSQLGQGSTFTFTVHYAASLESERPVTFSPLQKAVPCLPPSRTASVLLVEDNAVIQRLLHRMLSTFPVSVTVASNGLEAVDMERSSAFDLALMDLEMPVMDGLEATQRIQARRQSASLAPLPIIALTGSSSVSDRTRAFEVGMVDFLSKPVLKATLAAILKKHLRGIT